MKTEMQQLEENTKEAYAKQRVGELSEKIDELHKEGLGAMNWASRTAILQGFNIANYFLCIVVAQYYTDGLPDWAIIAYLLLFTFIMAREHFFMKRFAYIDGTLDGIYLILDILYPNSDRDEGNKRQTKKVKAKSMFERFKEFYERVGQKQSKEVPA